MASPKQQFNWRKTLPGAALVVLVFIVYFPAMRGEFLWDDDSNIIKSAPLRSLGGLFRIWFQPGITQQYYPLTHSTWWLDFHIWGLHTTGYHLENILLHGISAVLVWVLLRRLSVKGAWLGAALFALHPVNVESVAWITERKNALSGVFFIGSLMAAARFWKLDGVVTNGQSAQSTANETGPWKFYALTLGLYLCALWSKTATVGLPAVIWLLLWWKRGLPRWRNVWLLLPFVVMGIGMSLITIWIEKNHLGATGEEWGFTPIQRIVIAGRAWWFYLGKLAWPHPLMFMYPLWNTQSPPLLAYLAPVVACVVVALLWVKRKTWAWPMLFAAGYFFVMLFPVLGFFNVVFYHYSFVSDHFQYLACIGPLALIGAGVSSAFGSAKNYNPIVEKVVCGLLLTVLAVISWRQAGVYRSPETLWHDTLSHNPKSWMAHDNLGTCYSMEGKFDEAKAEYLSALEIRPTDHMAYNDLGLDASRMGKLDDAVQYFGKALQLLPNYALGHYNLGNALARQGKFDEAIQQFTLGTQLDQNFAPMHYSLANALARKGNLDEAIAQYKTSLELDPDFGPAHANLGRTLAAKGNLDEALEHYRAALEIDPTSVDALANLGNALVTKKQFEEAAQCYRIALQIEPNSAIIHYNLAVALDRLGKKAESQKELNEAARLKETSSPRQ